MHAKTVAALSVDKRSWYKKVFMLPSMETPPRRRLRKLPMELEAHLSCVKTSTCRAIDEVGLVKVKIICFVYYFCWCLTLAGSAFISLPSLILPTDSHPDRERQPSPSVTTTLSLLAECKADSSSPSPSKHKAAAETTDYEQHTCLKRPPF